MMFALSPDEQIAAALNVLTCAHDVALSDDCQACQNPTGDPPIPCTVCARPATSTQLTWLDGTTDRPTCTRHQQTGDRCYVCGKRCSARVFQLDGTSRLTCARHIAYGTGDPIRGIRL